MNYTVTDIPLKKLNTHSTSKRKCELHKFTDGTEFMMYIITCRKRVAQFVFDPEDFDVIDGVAWVIGPRPHDAVLCKISNLSMYTLMLSCPWYILDRKHYSATHIHPQFKSTKNNDFRKV
ncbi:MAG: hypothetical protein Faunusvirus8_28 [Faunusvirus sp.]|jgi:hypothetical protein|uniref:Uncharacterized protein n=1 Tax=Faunusvirus sp. TaxID=2487766 RepID=A0A3G4ZZ78_9VIRU|nr:MAG: hypothetical protein Faunusvirus8_28 [Faunusvirus sp.]